MCVCVCVSVLFMAARSKVTQQRHRHLLPGSHVCLNNMVCVGAEVRGHLTWAEGGSVRHMI